MNLHSVIRVGYSKMAKRLKALSLFIFDYNIIFYSISYIGISSFYLFLLRNIETGYAIGFTVLLASVLHIILLRREKLRNIEEKNRLKIAVEDLESLDKKICIRSLMIVFVTILGVARVSLLFFTQEKSSKIVGGFTGSESKFLGYVSEEQEAKHTGTNLQVSVLEDLTYHPDESSLKGMKLLLKVDNYRDFTLGEVCKFSGRVEIPENFEDFDYKGYLRNKGIYLVMEYPVYECMEIKEEREGLYIRNKLVDLKNSLIKRIDSVLSTPQSSLLAGILFGEKRLFSKEFEEYVRIAGVSHIVAASGYNITILVVCINKIFLFLNKKVRIILGIIVVWMFALLSGLSASIVRACIMSTFSLWALLHGRNNTIHISIPLTIAIFVFLNPSIVYDVGFLLSISATLGLVYLSPVLEYLKKKVSRKGKILEEYVFPTMSCTISTLPISLITFQTFSIWAVPANVLILPVIEGSMLWGFLGIITENRFFYAIVYVQLKYFEYIVNLIGELGFGNWEIGKGLASAISFFIASITILLITYLYPIQNEKYNYYLREG